MFIMIHKKSHRKQVAYRKATRWALASALAAALIAGCTDPDPDIPKPEVKTVSAYGVSLDEEAVNMLAYQRAFQAAARYIATLDEMFELLVNL